MTSRQSQGWALISNRPAFVRRLHKKLKFRHILLQDDLKEPLPKIRAPLLLDTAGFEPLKLLLLLRAIRKAKIATVAIVRVNDVFAQRIVALCPQVRVIMSEQQELPTLLPPLTSFVASMKLDVPPTIVGLAPLPAIELPIVLIDLLCEALLGHDEKVLTSNCGISRASLFRLMTTIKETLQICCQTRVKREDLALLIIEALQQSSSQNVEIIRYVPLDKQLSLSQDKQKIKYQLSQVAREEQLSFFETSSI